jgi:hypothetical protein
MSDLMLPFTPLKNVDLLYSRVGAGAGAAVSKDSVLFHKLFPPPFVLG